MPETLTPEVIAWLMTPGATEEFPDVRDLIVRPAWMAQAACRGEAQAHFFPTGGGNSAVKARAICATCPVREPCLDYATADAEIRGIWGGTTERERQAMRVDLATTKKLQIPA